MQDAIFNGGSCQLYWNQEKIWPTGSPEPPDPTIVVIGGRRYPVADMPDGRKWMTENLDFKANGIHIGTGGSTYGSNARYYNDDESTYGVDGNKYGLLYNWYAVNYLNNNRSTLFPGWHVPTIDEWDALKTACGGTYSAGIKLKSTTDWSNGNGDGSTGFNAFPAGYGYFSSGTMYFWDSLYETRFWTATNYSSSQSYGYKIDSDEVISTISRKEQYYCSLRLIKDT